jgi:aryl-alcohol dehydrogenase-like predicted oxidoreductase
LKQKGLIRAIGVSNFSPAQMARFRMKALLSSDQPPFNIFERGIEKEVLPYCRTNNTGRSSTESFAGAFCPGR